VLRLPSESPEGPGASSLTRSGPAAPACGCAPLPPCVTAVPPPARPPRPAAAPTAVPPSGHPRSGKASARRTSGSVALSRCATAHPLHTRLINIHMYSVPLYLKRRCHRTPGEPRRALQRLPALRRRQRLHGPHPAQAGSGPPGRLSAFSVSHMKSALYGVFVWARRALNDHFRLFPARAGRAVLGPDPVAAGARAQPPAGEPSLPPRRSRHMRCAQGVSITV
jgi:hypothetical protein